MKESWEEIESILNMLCSKDPEINRLGWNMFRRTKFYEYSGYVRCGQTFMNFI